MNNAELHKIIHKISFKPKERLDIFQSLPESSQADVILRLTKHMQYEILSKLKDDEIINLAGYLDPDELTDVLQLLPAKKSNKIIEKLNTSLKEDITKLLEFDPKTAGGLMNVDYIQVDEDDSISNTLKKLKIHEKRTGRLPAIIVDKDGKVSGYLPGHELGFAKQYEKVKKYVRHIETIDHNAEHEDVLKKFKDYPHNKLVVVGDKKNVIGIIYSDDVLGIMHEQASKSLYDLAGVSEEEQVQDSALAKVKFRYKWLIINLGTAFLAAFTVGLFDETISKYVLLAVYMPIVAGMGGNAATQTLAVLVRGIAYGQITLKNAWKALKNEVSAGFVNGIINGIIVSVVIIILNHDIKLALVITIAMIANLMIAGLFGTMVPLIMQKLGKDPASSATIFITTATDVFGFLSFLGLATLLLT